MHVTHLKRLTLLLSILFNFHSVKSQSDLVEMDLLIVGGGASGISAGIQSARQGINVLIIEETEWLGGMLTAAGVSATDGNHQMPSGIWGEFRDSIYAHYGGPEKVATGWISHTLFEPSVGNRIFQNMAAAEPLLSVHYQTSFLSAKRSGDYWLVKGRNRKGIYEIKTKFIIDATELGEVMAQLNINYDLGMESRENSKEEYAPQIANDIVQDLTYTVILQDYGKPSLIKKPKGYSPDPFKCACEQPESEKKISEDCLQMMAYAKLPNDKYLINWPNCGNDYYVNLAALSAEDRSKEIEKAKQFSLQFVYYIQNELGLKNLGIAKQEFPSKDGLPLIPYHRESRRLVGKARLNAHHLEEPFTQKEKYYRTGIAVGDYPIDHHHKKNANAPAIDFINIKVPSYNVPIGSLIPKQNVPNFLVAEKNISVSNIVNGTTRLQPVVLGIGQAAGAIASYCIKNEVNTDEINIREVQKTLLESKAYVMPYIDVKPDHSHFLTIQKIGATGILKGVGIPYKWANETWFYPDHSISEYEMVQGLKDFYTSLSLSEGSGGALTVTFLSQLINEIDATINPDKILQEITGIDVLSGLTEKSELTKLQTAIIINEFLNPFATPINFEGHVQFNTLHNQE
jgi:hypothetical protein